MVVSKDSTLLWFKYLGYLFKEQTYFVTRNVAVDDVCIYLTDTPLCECLNKHNL